MISFKLLCSFLLFLYCVNLHAEVRFSEVKQDFNHEYSGDWEHFVGGGVSDFDCNNDEFPELFIAGGSKPSILLINKTTSPGTAVRFSSQTTSNLELRNVTGSYPLDIDNDGIMDLVVMRVGENYLLKGEDNCQFSKFPESFGFNSGDHWSTAFTASWEKEAVLPTLAFGNYVDRSDPEGPFEACDKNYLYRPDLNHFVKPIALEPGFCALSMLFSDWGRKGQMDLRISNDRHYYVRDGAEQMWTLESKPKLYREVDGWRNHSIWGMGIASRDITGDGFPEVFLTSMGDQKLQQLENNATGPSYRNARYDRGITAHRPFMGDDGRPSTGWHAEFTDVNNDGFDDIFVAKGNVEQMPSSAINDPNNLLLQNESGQFVEHAEKAGIASFARSRGATLTDLNLDGLPDLVVVNRRAALEIYQNKSTGSGNWLLIKVEQPSPNNQAIGSWIEIKNNEKTWHREITVGGGHASGSSGYHHFGLGSSKMIKFRLVWPDGEVSEWLEIETNQRIKITRKEQRLRLHSY